MALFLVATPDPEFAAAAEAAARYQFAEHGLRDVEAFALDGWRLLHARPILGGPETRLVRGDDLVAVAGMPVVDGLIGEAALERLLDLAPRPDWQRIGGQFVALVRRHGRTFLLGDWMGINQLFHDVSERIFSTSMLSVLHALPRVSFDTQGVYEWGLGVCTTGRDTIWNEVKLLGLEQMVELTARGAVIHPLPKPVFDWTVEPLPVQERLARNQVHVMEKAESYRRAFGDAIYCPLSAGFDSRLLLAALRAAGCRPSVYVYGRRGGADVEVAQAIGAAEGFPVEWIDKHADPIAPDAFAAQVERNFHDLDGLPTYGNLFDNGANAAARDRRHASGALAVSGVGGEVYRDFFMLPDRPISTWTLTRSYNSRFLASDATGLFDPDRYLRTIADKTAALLGTEDRNEPLPRGVIEQALPRIRAPAFMRWEHNAESRHGAYGMPFYDPVLIAEAMRLPLSLKREGRFEAMLINAIDPALARHRSGYGHDFSGAPGWRYRLEEAATRYRPTWLRERTYRMKRRRGRMMDEHGGLLSPDYMGRVIDLEFPVMRRFFNVERIADGGLWRRVACLEYVAQRLGSRLAT